MDLFVVLVVVFFAGVPPDFFAVDEAVFEEAVVLAAVVVFLAAAVLEAAVVFEADVVFEDEAVLEAAGAGLPPFGASRRDFCVMPSAFAIALS